MADDTEDGPVILFDGYCSLCNGAVRFVLARDDGLFRIAPLQSRAGRRVLARHGREPGERNTLVLVDADGVHTRSTAWCRVLARLDGPWSVLGTALLRVPRPVRDLGYQVVARLRSRIFGRRDACMPPGPAAEERFLDGSDDIVD